MNRSGVYAIVNTLNGKHYIGSTVCFKKRFASHKKRLLNKEHHSPHLQSSWNKYGGDSFIFLPLLICHKKHLLEYEQRCIDGFKPEYNVCPTAASWLGHKHSEESRKKMTASRTGKALSKEHIANMSKARLGKKLSPERIEALRQCNFGRKHSDETKAKLSIARIGKPLAPEICAKMSASRTGKKRAPFSPAHLAAISKGQIARRKREREMDLRLFI